MCNTPSPAVNGSAWEFFLYINNQTGHTLEVYNSKKDWGVWYRNSQDKLEPIKVEPGTSAQALGIRASHGTATGYECRCCWDYKVDGKALGKIDLKIDVPYSGSNSSSLTVSGNVRIEGWEALPKKGHNFTRSITVSEVNALPTAAKTSSEQLNSEDKAYCDLIMANNEMVQNWAMLRDNVQEINEFDPTAVLPETYTYPPRSIFVGRTPQHLIEHTLWQDIDDPIYEWNWQKDQYVEQYFSVGIYSFNTNPRSTVNIPKGVEKVTEGSVEVTSSISKTLKSTLSVRSLLKGEYSGLTAELETTYSTEHLLEESNSRVERAVETISIGASDKNRLFVPWVFSTAIAIYRQKKDGSITLIGISEWAEEILDKVYEY